MAILLESSGARILRANTVNSSTTRRQAPYPHDAADHGASILHELDPHPGAPPRIIRNSHAVVSNR